MKNYTGVTLLNTAYKIYAGILNERLKKEVEGKLNEGQFGFRKRKGVIDAVYVLNYLVNREIKKPGRKVFAFFADLKAAFDRVDRGVLGDRMKRMEISQGLRQRIMETFEETRNVIRVGEKYSKTFWTNKGVRQGCPMSPTLFNIYIADLEEELRKEQEGSLVIGKGKMWSLTYADDIVIMARGENELKNMLKRFEKYLKKKKLTLSTEKSKIIVFGRERGKVKKRKWR